MASPHHVEAREYLEKHGVIERLKQAVSDAVRDRPDDPLAAIGHALLPSERGDDNSKAPNAIIGKGPATPTRPPPKVVDVFGSPVADPTPAALRPINEYLEAVLSGGAEDLAAAGKDVAEAADAHPGSAMVQLLAADALQQSSTDRGARPAGNDRLDAAVSALGGGDNPSMDERRPPPREGGYLAALRATASGDFNGAYKAWLEVVRTYPADGFAAERAMTSARAYPIELGTTYTQPIRTTGPCARACQLWFDRGCVWAAAYHREEAFFCFGEAAKADPGCAMAHWGCALCNGPDYNFSAKGGFYAVASQPAGYPSLKVATDAISKALELSAADAEAPPRERALIKALAERYEWPVRDETPSLQEAYADAMASVAEAFPDDPDVHALHAEALMCLAPWAMYEKGPGADAGSPVWRSTDKVLTAVGTRVAAALERGLACAPSHVWLCHLKIHLCEMGPPEAFDWAAAEAVRAFDATGCGHLVHMPTHLDFQVGKYAEAVRCNVLGYEADLALYGSAAAGCPSRFGIYTGYVVHNMEFCVWAAMYGANLASAQKAADAIDGFFTEGLLRSFPHLPTFFEAYSATPLMVLVRFGQWEKILATPYEADATLYVARTLFLHYAKGIAHGVRGELDAARGFLEQLREGLQGLQKGQRLHHNVDLVEMGAIALHVLEGEVLYRQAALAAAAAAAAGEQGGEAASFDGAYAALERGIACFDALPYDEPHGWLMSVRQTLAALLTEQGEWGRAVGLYVEDLELFPANPWSLAGLVRCYRAQGEGMQDALDETEAMLAEALRAADVKVGASCACALSHWDEGQGGAAEGAGTGSACCTGSEQGSKGGNGSPASRAATEAWHDV